MISMGKFLKQSRDLSPIFQISAPSSNYWLCCIDWSLSLSSFRKKISFCRFLVLSCTTITTTFENFHKVEMFSGQPSSAYTGKENNCVSNPVMIICLQDLVYCHQLRRDVSQSSISVSLQSLIPLV